jgi:prepilin-type N-terminal cleavage/methylation domain-containing protein
MRKFEKSAKTGFTLTELLVTVGIMAVVITLTIPAFTGLGRGAKMDSALSGLKSTFSLARQWAITHRDTVYVVFPAGRVRTGYGIAALRTYMVFSETEQDYISEPTQLPEGIILDLQQLSTLPSSLPAWLSTKLRNVARDPIYFLAFNQHGGLESGAATQTIYLIEGTTPERGVISASDVTRTFGKGSGRADAVKVNGITGLPYVERDIDE